MRHGVRAALVALALAAGGPTLAKDLALVGGRVHPAPGVPPLEDGVVLVRDGRIAAVGARDAVALPPDAHVLDCSGRTVTAAFWNSHAHLSAWRMLAGGWLAGRLAEGELHEMFARFGFVHVLDTGSPFGIGVRLRERAASSALYPEIRTTGTGFVAPGGSPFYLKPFRLPELANADAARAAVAEQLAGGADGIKLFTGGLAAPGSVVVMDVAVVRAVSEAAHARGAFVVAHPSNSAGARAAVEGGVDILAHTFPMEGEAWDRSLLPEMKARGMALTPTLKLWKYELERAGRPPEQLASWLRAAQEQVRGFAALDGQILFGTDVGYMRDFDPSDEYAYLSEAGLSFTELLAALTTSPAARFGKSDRSGRIARGFEADLVVLEGDPAEDPRAFARVRFTLQRGVLVHDARE